MSTRHRVVRAPIDRVWEVLADGWLYPLFVVGASRMRAVDAGWPAVGTRLHHSVGAWPAMLDDRTEVLDVDPGRRLRLRAHGWPAGAAEVVFTLSPAEGERGDGTRVELHEDVVAGPGRLLPKPLRDPQISWRNTETLRRLALLCEGRAG